MAAILKKVKCDNSATIRPILMKFCMLLHLSLLNLIGNQKFQNFKIQDGGQRPSKKSKNHDYLRNCLADFDVILHDGTY